MNELELRNMRLLQYTVHHAREITDARCLSEVTSDETSSTVLQTLGTQSRMKEGLRLDMGGTSGA